MLSIDWTPKFGEWQTEFLVEGFYTKLDNPFVNEYGEADENGVVVYTRMNAEKGASVKGVNFEFNAAPSKEFSVSLGYTHQISEYEEAQEFDEKSFFRTPNDYGYFTLNWSPVSKVNLSTTANYTGEMLVPYFGTEAPVDPVTDEVIGELRTSDPFFDLGMKLSYQFRLNGGVNVETSAGVKNIFNSYQDDFDSGLERDPGYVYGPMNPRMITFGLKFSNLF